ncbi:hypothetical protein [Pseudomonas aeruginosa]|uniref:hypothetical protein n=1 Tax=Pseudomonas aeruginosa TaxID=287 RepID=UPI000F87CF0B|nr:hypothetical protein [Pseudomonas aeruginosa]RSZ54057.1 hypothetical protein EJU38_05465 [Pseudomonas aeruginosa]WOT60880.1 hypothetical protein R5018_25135 [Pseudomonas aeruginosa]WOT74312.1 hypothetical protein R5026_27820 [Pseudomonas aeruginosa]WOT85433.1 hypothetical protein R5020_18780 [Pseudomonas aeruginosa]WOT98387.1 hypothetical protein R5015_18710 [Pseudomonas aeruginosa]
MTKKMSVDLRTGDVLLVGGAAIRLEKKSGQVARLVIEADEGTVIKNPSQARKSALQDLEHTHGQHPV